MKFLLYLLRTQVLCYADQAFSNSMASSAFLNSLPGLKRGRTLVIWLPRTASAESAPSASLLSQKLPKLPSAQFFRNGGQQGFQHGQRIRAADGGDGADLPGQFAQGQAPAGLDGRVEFLGGFEE